MTQIVQTPEQQFYLAKLLGYSYEIVYKPGAQNHVADALSWIHTNVHQCLLITIPHWDFLVQLSNSFKNDVELQAMVQEISQDPAAHPNFEIINDLVFFKGKLYLPPSFPFK